MYRNHAANKLIADWIDKNLGTLETRMLHDKDMVHEARETLIKSIVNTMVNENIIRFKTEYYAGLNQWLTHAHVMIRKRTR